MYYDEKWIDGTLHHRGSPTADWIPFTIAQYKERCFKQEMKIKQLDEKIAKLENTEAI